jgi:hypothetical protein
MYYILVRCTHVCRICTQRKTQYNYKLWTAFLSLSVVTIGTAGLLTNH